MKYFFTKAISLLLAGLMLLSLAACSPDLEIQGPETSAQAEDLGVYAGRGRFAESALQLPRNTGRVYGSLTEVGGKLRFGNYESGDCGESWTQLELPEELEKLAEREEFHINISWGAGGEAFYVCNEYDSEDNKFIAHYYYAGSGGEVRELDIIIPEAPEQMAANSISFNNCLLPDGSIIALDSYNCLMHIDQHTGEILRTMYDDYYGDRRYNNFYITDDTLILNVYSDDGQVIELYDLETWEPKGRDEVLNSFIKGPEGAYSADEFSYDPDGLPGSFSASMQYIFTCPGEEAVYVASRRGLYRHVLGGTAMERVIDGSRYSLGDTSRYIDNIIKTSSGDFYAFCTDYDTDESFLLRWHYEPELPAEPETELQIFAMYDNSELRRSISRYQRDNPGVEISVEIGTESHSEWSEAQIFEALSKTLRDGGGPDILLLDGMPYREFIRDGLLEDITGLTDGLGVIPNLISAFCQEDRSYAVPMRFSVPVLMGDSDVLARITDLESFAEQAEAMLEDGVEKNILGLDEWTLLGKMTAGSSAAWYREDSSIDRDKLSEFLKLCGRIYNADFSRPDIPKPMAYSPGDCGSLIAGGWARITKDTVCNYMTFTSMLAVDEKYNVGHTLVSGQSPKVFIPHCLLGISSSGGSKELCREFLRSVLSEENQNVDHTAETLPVNEAALRKTLAIEQISAHGLLGANGKQVFTQYHTATDEQIDEFVDLIGTLETPAYGSEALFRALSSIGADYLRGEIELEAALDEIISALDYS